MPIVSTWYQFRSFWSPKNSHSDNMSSYEFWIFGYFRYLQVWNSKKKKKNENSKPLKLLKWQFLTPWNQLKWISRKISNQSGRKKAKFPHCEISTVKLPIMLVRSVLSLTITHSCWPNTLRSSETFHSKINNIKSILFSQDYITSNVSILMCLWKRGVNFLNCQIFIMTS